MAEGPRELSGVSFVRALIPSMRAKPSWLNGLTKAPPFTTITFQVRASVCSRCYDPVLFVCLFLLDFPNCHLKHCLSAFLSPFIDGILKLRVLWRDGHHCPAASLLLLFYAELHPVKPAHFNIWSPGSLFLFSFFPLYCLRYFKWDLIPPMTCLVVMSWKSHQHLSAFQWRTDQGGK